MPVTGAGGWHCRASEQALALIVAAVTRDRALRGKLLKYSYRFSNRPPLIFSGGCTLAIASRGSMIRNGPESVPRKPAV